MVLRLPGTNIYDIIIHLNTYFRLLLLNYYYYSSYYSRTILISNWWIAVESPSGVAPGSLGLIHLNRNKICCKWSTTASRLLETPQSRLDSDFLPAAIATRLPISRSFATSRRRRRKLQRRETSARAVSDLSVFRGRLEPSLRRPSAIELKRFSNLGLVSPSIPGASMWCLRRTKPRHTKRQFSFWIASKPTHRLFRSIYFQIWCLIFTLGDFLLI